MDDTEDDARYPPKHYSVNNRAPFDSSARSKHSNRNPSYLTNNNTYRDEDDEYEDDELDEEDQGVKQEFDDQDDEDDDEDEDDEDGNEEDFDNGYDETGRRQKKRRLDNLVSNYEFVPRKPLAPAPARNSSVVEWTDQATFVLLEAWGDRFLQLGRKTLRSEDWQDVAEKVSEGSKVDWTDSQCRNRLDTLKKKYKKEKAKIDSSGGGYSSKWVFFKKMDMLLSSSSSKQQVGLPCGVDSGEYVFMNPRVYLNRSNGLDELRDSPGESESSDDDDQDLYGLHSSKGGKGDSNGSSFKLLADSVHKFGEIYEKIESSKRQQMMDLEKMRMDFQRELEVQKKQILERAQAEIAKIREGDEEDETDGSAENFSG